MDGHHGSTVVDHLSKWGWVLPGVNGANDVSGSRHCVNGVKADEEVCGRQQLGGGHFDAIVISRHCEDGVKADEVCGRQKHVGGHFDATVVSRHCDDGVKADEVAGGQQHGGGKSCGDMPWTKK